MAITISKVRLSFPQLFEPKSFDNNPETAKYSTQIVIPKGSKQEQMIRDEYDRVLQEAIDNKKLTKANATPLIRPAGSNRGLLVDCDMDEEKYDPEIFGGCYVMNAKSKTRPLVVTRTHEPIEAKDGEIYGGVVCDVNVNIFAYSKIGSGITVGLNGVMKVGEGERFGGGRPSVTQMFGAAASDDIYD